ncbi:MULTISPECIES: hypothetical protein [Azotobacter]|uniref:hypothetical protein n=1 Tax=Azotobacter chroococcum TaxID=353 RepID=UPI000589B8F9|nr:hypothetical protein [Azotobacter chroococcum]ASL28952.1 hypothetical protein ACG10_21950 [Azotobacter chroococcum]
MRSSMACVIEGQSSAFDALKALGRQAGNDLLLSCTLPVDRRVIEALSRAAARRVRLDGQRYVCLFDEGPFAEGFYESSGLNRTELLNWCGLEAR